MREFSSILNSRFKNAANKNKGPTKTGIFNLEGAGYNGVKLLIYWSDTVLQGDHLKMLKSWDLQDLDNGIVFGVRQGDHLRMLNSWDIQGVQTKKW